MSRPFRAQSHEAATSTGVGESFNTKGHNSLGIYVVARNLDPANDSLEVKLSGSVDDEGAWADIHTTGGNKPNVTSDDFQDPDGDGTYAAFTYAHGVPIEYVRAQIVTLDDSSGGDLEVDTYVLGANNGGTGHAYEHA